MSRVGKKPVVVPDKVKAELTGGVLSVTGPVGTLKLQIPGCLKIAIKDGSISLERANDDVRAMHGLYRALIQNMATGVSKGFSRSLDIVGVGYKSEVKGSNLEISVGYSHPVVFPIPQGIKISVDKQMHITVFGADKVLVGEVSAIIRKTRPPEPYKGKGIRYAGEVVRKKVGKVAQAIGGAGGAK